MLASLHHPSPMRGDDRVVVLAELRPRNGNRATPPATLKHRHSARVFGHARILAHPCLNRQFSRACARARERTGRGRWAGCFLNMWEHSAALLRWWAERRERRSDGYEIAVYRLRDRKIADGGSTPNR